MNDPKRWLDDDGVASSEERALLEAGRDDRIPVALRERVWLGVAAGASAAAVPSAAAAALPKGAVSKGVLSLFTGSLGKGLLGVALVSGAGLGVFGLRASKKMASNSTAVPSQPSRTTSIAPIAPPPIAPPVTEPKTGDEDLPPQDVLSPAIVPPRPAPSHATTAKAASGSRPADSRLREESAAVLAVRNALVSGDAALALRLLDRARVDFPNGALAEDREALTVRALATGGQKEAAHSRGESFLRAFPKSPYAAEVRAILAR
jgi:hypothetical protein